MSEPQEIPSPLAGLHAQQQQEMLVTLDRVSQGHSMFRGMAHDLSNVSHAFSIGTYGIQADAIDTEKWVSMTRWIEGKMSRAVAILRDFGAPADDEIRPVIVHEVLTTVHQWQELQRAQPEVQVQLHVDRDLAPVRASESRLRQVILALIANAKDAMVGKNEAEVRLVATPSGDGVAIAVEDAGPGIGADVRDRVFDAFFTTKDTDTHVGLGLTVARATVESWGGNLSIDSCEAGGASVGLWLPCWPSQGHEE